MKICQTGDRSKGDPKYKFSSLSHDIDMIEPRTPKLSRFFSFFAFPDVTKYLTQIFEGSTKSTVGMSDRLWSLKFDGCVR